MKNPIGEKLRRVARYEILKVLEEDLDATAVFKSKMDQKTKIAMGIGAAAVAGNVVNFVVSGWATRKAKKASSDVTELAELVASDIAVVEDSIERITNAMLTMQASNGQLDPDTIANIRNIQDVMAMREDAEIVALEDEDQEE